MTHLLYPRLLQSKYTRLIADAISTGFGSGLWPYAGKGTVASAVAVAIYWVLPFGGSSVWIFAMVAITAVIGTIAIYFSLRPGEADPSRVVIDEWLGVWVAVLFLPKEWPWLVAGFALFRLLDILKPIGIRRLERLHGGIGIMADDAAAGVVAAGVLNGIRLIFFA